MKRIFRILGLSLVVVAILAIAIAGTVSAVGNNPGTGSQTQDQGTVCPCGNCVCDNCDSINNSYDHNYNYLSPGPHGQQNGK